jgi:hypothetical protein
VIDITSSFSRKPFMNWICSAGRVGTKVSIRLRLLNPTATYRDQACCFKQPLTWFRYGLVSIRLRLLNPRPTQPKAYSTGVRSGLRACLKSPVRDVMFIAADASTPIPSPVRGDILPGVWGIFPMWHISLLAELGFLERAPEL